MPTFSPAWGKESALPEDIVPGRIYFTTDTGKIFLDTDDGHRQAFIPDIQISEVPVPIAEGGTGATSSSQALTNLGAAPASHKHAMTDLNGTLPISKGGTGATSADAARTNLGAAPISHSHSNFSPQNISSGTNLNNLTNPGFYYSPTNATVGTFANCPTGNAFFLMVGQHAGTYQRLVEYPTSNPKIFFRNFYNGSWGSWFREFTTVDTPTYSQVGAAASNHSHSAGSLSGTLPISHGGTGASSAPYARGNLGVPAEIDIGDGSNGFPFSWGTVCARSSLGNSIGQATADNYYWGVDSTATLWGGKQTNRATSPTWRRAMMIDGSQDTVTL